MTIIEFSIIVLFNIIILTLALKTKIYYKILVIIKKMMPKIILIFLLFWPLYLFVLLLTILNAICNLPNETVVLKTINSYSYLGELKQFGLNCILYSPTIFLLMSFLLRGSYYMKNEENKFPKTKNIQNDILRMKVSIFSGNITIFLGLVFIFLSKSINVEILDMKFIQFIQEYQISDIITFSEYSILMLLVIVLCYFCYIGIFWVSDNCLVSLLIHDKTIIEKSKKTWKYNILT